MARESVTGTLDPPSWAKVPQAELLLDEMGLAWTLEWVSWEEIDREASLHNQARSVPLADDRITRLKIAARSGAKFPAGLAGRWRPTDLLVLADGNGRREALEDVEALGMWVYVFTVTDAAEFMVVSKLANVRLNGEQNTLTESLMHASYFMDTTGVSLDEASVQFQVTPAQLRHFRAAMAFRQRMSALHIPGSLAADLSDSQLAQLGGAVADSALRLALEIATKDKVGTKRVLEVARDAGRAGRSGVEKGKLQEAALAQLRKEATQRTPKRLLQARRQDTLAQRLSSARQAIGEWLASPRPELEHIIDEIRDLLCE